MDQLKHLCLAVPLRRDSPSGVNTFGGVKIHRDLPERIIAYLAYEIRLGTNSQRLTPPFILKQLVSIHTFKNRLIRRGG
jgi:hypothetical protein